DVDAERFSHSAIVDGGANLGAEARALEAEPKADDNRDADHDQENTVGAVIQKTEIELTAQCVRKKQRLVLGTNPNRHRGNKDKHEADGEEHLVEFGGFVETHIKQPLQNGTDGRGDDEPENERGKESDAPISHRQDDYVTAEHGEGAM